MKISGVPLIAVTAFMLIGCGGDSKEPSKASKTPIPLSSAPSYDSARRACGASGPDALAHSLGVTTTNPATLAKTYAERKAPPGLREGAEKGCYAGLTK